VDHRLAPRGHGGYSVEDEFDAQKENHVNNILKLAGQARVNAQMLSVNHKGIRDLSHEDALKVRGEIDEAIRRLQEFGKDLAKKLDTPGRRP
jgi:hypothetical protein